MIIWYSSIQNNCSKTFLTFSLPFVHNIRDILKVRLGEYDVSTTAEPLRHEEFNITDIVVYPGFNNSTLVHDIALLRLERPAKRKQNIDVVCMPKPDDFRPPTTSRSTGVKCYVTGWGRRTESKLIWLYVLCISDKNLWIEHKRSLNFDICFSAFSFRAFFSTKRNQSASLESWYL